MKVNYKKIYNFVKEKFDKTDYFNRGAFDEVYFTLRVYESTKEIISKLGKKVKREEVLVASLLHDVGKIKLDGSKVFNEKGFLIDPDKEWSKHADFSVKIAKNYLNKEGFSQKFIDSVCYLIKNHDLRELNSSEKSLELKILQDADLLADIGLSGFIRVFLYGGQFNKSIFHSIKFLEKDDRILGGQKLNLKVSKKIAKKEMKIQKDLVKRMRDKINSDLMEK